MQCSMLLIPKQKVKAVNRSNTSGENDHASTDDSEDNNIDESGDQNDGLEITVSLSVSSDKNLSVHCF
jgi:hypothetical protein